MKLRNKYFILRHGQTIYQTKKKNFIYPPFPEKPPVKLTKKGEKQIKTAAKSLKKAGIDLIFSSDFFRTRQTAKIVAKEMGAKILFDKRLRDINLGIYRDGKKEKFYRVFPPHSKKFFHQKPPQGESWLDCQKMMLNFLKSLDKKYKGKNILIVSHKDPLWLLEGAVKNWSMRKLLKVKISKSDIETGEIRQL
jgi:broad specificity phosphatase PhoE